jgi:predicted transposase YbfD/YdcC
VEDKSNEITALPELLRQLTIRDCVVTIDAMGCQTEIAEQILAQEADQVLALKANQADLLEEVIDCFTQAETDTYQEVCIQAAETISKEHGRLEIRRHTVLTEPEYLTRAVWPSSTGRAYKPWGEWRPSDASERSGPRRPASICSARR